jgi:DNA (cytosine-5)-methyltransferase 1
MRSLDLFSGIGGFALGLEQAGIDTAAFCEVDPYARRVLATRFPTAPIYNDVRTLNADKLQADGVGLPDVICGGFPCQDISLNGRGEGLAGARSGLWWEFHRLVAECRPRFVLAENVAALRSRGLEDVLRSLAALGYDAEWHCLPASAVGAPQRRDRVWIVAYPAGFGMEGLRAEGKQVLRGLEQTRLLDRESLSLDRPDPWTPEPNVGRVVDGVPARVDRLRCLGNAVVPAIPMLIGRVIMQHRSADRETSE